MTLQRTSLIFHFQILTYFGSQFYRDVGLCIRLAAGGAAAAAAAAAKNGVEGCLCLQYGDPSALSDCPTAILPALNTQP